MTIEATGWIIYTHEAIFGTGETAEAAWADAEQWMDDPVEDKDADELDSSDGPWARPATAALLAEVAKRGGAISWGNVDGVACTKAEEEEED